MNHVERFRAVMHGQPVDRLPIWEWAMWWDKTIAQWERDWVSQALSRSAGNQSAAARLLGLTRDELRYRVDKFVMEPAV